MYWWAKTPHVPNGWGLGDWREKTFWITSRLLAIVAARGPL